MLSAAQIQQRRDAGKARAKQFTPEFQAAARAHVARESLVAGGKAGNQACVEKYGPAVHVRRAARWRKTRPTRLMQTVMGWLDSAWVLFDIEVELVAGHAYGDIVLYDSRGRHLDVEVDGAYFHELPGRAEHDQARDALVTAAGYTVIRLSEADIESGAAKAALSKAIGVEL